MSFCTDVAKEVNRLIKQENYTNDRNDVFKSGELAGASVCYILNTLRIANKDLSHKVKSFIKELWPWNEHYWKPSDIQRNDLVHATALLILEGERRDILTKVNNENKFSTIIVNKETNPFEKQMID